MKRYNKTALITGVILGAIITISGISFAESDLNRDALNEKRIGKHQFCSKHHDKIKREQKEIIKKALENKDGDAFKDAISKQKLERVNEEIFAKMAEMHEARKDGDIDRVEEIMKELSDLGFERKGEHRRENR